MIRDIYKKIENLLIYCWVVPALRYLIILVVFSLILRLFFGDSNESTERLFHLW